MRLRDNFVKGTIETEGDVPLGATATVFASEGLANLSAVTAANVAVVVLDPLGTDGEPEIVYVTAHVADAETATVARGQGGSTARAHAAGTPWLHGPVADDFGAAVRGRRWVRGIETIIDPDTFTPVPETSVVSNPADDEFDDDVLDPAWIPVSWAAQERWVEHGDALSMTMQRQVASTANQVTALLKPIGANFGIGQAIETCVTYSGPNVPTPRFGLILANGTTAGAGVQVMASVDMSTTSPFRSFGTRTHVGFNATPVATVVGLSPATPARLFIRLAWFDVNTFSAWYSGDGVSWCTDIVASRTLTLTPTHMGLFTIANAHGYVYSLSFDYFRVTPFREGWQWY